MWSANICSSETGRASGTVGLAFPCGFSGAAGGFTSPASFSEAWANGELKPCDLFFFMTGAGFGIRLSWWPPADRRRPARRRARRDPRRARPRRHQRRRQHQVAHPAHHRDPACEHVGHHLINHHGPSRHLVLHGVEGLAAPAIAHQVDRPEHAQAAYVTDAGMDLADALEAGSDVLAHAARAGDQSSRLYSSMAAMAGASVSGCAS